MKARASRVALWFVVGIAATTAQAAPQLLEVRGRLEIASLSEPGSEPRGFERAETGQALPANAILRTATDGRAEIALGSVAIRLHGASEMVLSNAETTQPEATLAHGLALVRVTSSDASIAIETPEVRVVARGKARFAVAALDEAVSVAVQRGSVGVLPLRSDFGHSVQVREGFAAFGPGTKPPEIFFDTGPDPWSRWPDAAPLALPGRVRPLPASPAAPDASPTLGGSALAGVTIRAIGDAVRIVGPAPFEIWQLDRARLEAVARGTADLPPRLVSLLAQGGIADPAGFSSGLVQRLGRDEPSNDRLR